MLIKKSVSLFVLAATTMVMFAFRAAPANFSGTWALNESKSELGQFGARGAASKITVDQKTESIAISRTTAGFNGEEVVTTETLTEGKEVETTVFNGNAKKKSTLKWASDQQGFTITYSISGEFNGNAFEFKGTEVWSLSADGKALTLDGKFSSQMGEAATKAVYDKK